MTKRASESITQYSHELYLMIQHKQVNIVEALRLAARYGHLQGCVDCYQDDVERLKEIMPDSLAEKQFNAVGIRSGADND
jgi:hypothetical protein